MDAKASSGIQLPPGFRFHPSDEELIVHYLKNRVSSSPLPASIIAEIDLYKYNPWEVPKKALFGVDEWYFFTPRDRKYPNGARPNRAAASGYWKATGTDKSILNSFGTAKIGVKKTLVFYEGRPPKGLKTDWNMHEYRLLDAMIWNNLDWVLCRVRQKNSIPRNTWQDQNIPSCASAPTGLFPKVNELQQMNINPDTEMVANYFYDDCPMLPRIFSPQNFPSSTERASSINFLSSDKSCTSFHNLLNPLKRKPAETNQQRGNCFPPGKMLRTKADIEEDVVSIRNDGTDENFSGADQSESGNFSTEQWNSPMQ
ncbi:hypothetical protein NC652_016587 [Populus alba x Populus x berolinensis]|nr:hypothetical protein NC652_016587 [Populus alba x Populus x berolinensis]